MIQDNTAKWRKKKLSNFASNNAMPVGHIYQTLSKNVPVGSLPLFGGTYDRSLYADLWSWANENGLVISESEWQAMATAQGGSCSKFSDGNGSTTFRVPALKCWVRGANGVEEVGSYLKAGLPNITGSSGASTICNSDGLGVVISGAFYEGSWVTPYGATQGGGDVRVHMDASRCSSIYGNSDTVQPPSIVAMWCIVAYGSISNIGNIDVATAISAIENSRLRVKVW